MKLSIITENFTLSFEVKKLNYYGDNWFVFEAELTSNFVEWLSSEQLIYTQPTKGSYQLAKGVEFSLE